MPVQKMEQTLNATWIILQAMPNIFDMSDRSYLIKEKKIKFIKDQHIDEESSEKFYGVVFVDSEEPEYIWGTELVNTEIIKPETEAKTEETLDLNVGANGSVTTSNGQYIGKLYTVKEVAEIIKDYSVFDLLELQDQVNGYIRQKVNEDLPQETEDQE